MDATGLISPFALAFKAYTPIEPPSEIADRLGIPAADIIKLDANENPFGVPQSVKEALFRADAMHIYPDPAQRKVRRLIAEYAGVAPENVVAGAGADELLDLVCRLFLRPGDKVLTFAPTFSYYEHVICLNHAQPDVIPLDQNFAYDREKIDQADLSEFKAVFLCSPNNPTGQALPTDIAERFLAQKHMLVVMDEAYYEYCGKTFTDRLARFPRLIVIRTFSKFFALAGFRIGYALMHPSVAQIMMAIKPPYSVSVQSEISLQACLSEIKVFQTQAEEIKQNRAYLLSTISKIDSLKPYASESNFFLCESEQIPAGVLKQKLEELGIFVRYYGSNKMLKNCLRISVGTRIQCQRLVDCLRQIVGEELK